MKKYILRLITTIITAFLVWAITNPDVLKDTFSTLEQSQPELYVVVSFNDGDTITVDMNGTNERIRFIGIDTPELNHPDRGVQCFANEASRFTRELIGDNRVRLEADPKNSNRDRYDRLLRYVYLPDGTFVNQEIIRQGYGFAYTAFNFNYLDEFQDDENEAREQSRGLWSDCDINKNNGYINTQTISPFEAD